MVRRTVLLVGALIVALVGVAAAAAGLLPGHEPADPIAVVGRSGPDAFTVPQPAPARVDAPPTTAVVLAPAAVTAVASQSSTVVVTGGGRVSVVSSGAAVASTGGNTVVGSNQPGGQASVVNGPVTAIGSSSDVQVLSRP